MAVAGNFRSHTGSCKLKFNQLQPAGARLVPATIVRAKSIPPCPPILSWRDAREESSLLPIVGSQAGRRQNKRVDEQQSWEALLGNWRELKPTNFMIAQASRFSCFGRGRLWFGRAHFVGRHAGRVLRSELFLATGERS